MTTEKRDERTQVSVSEDKNPKGPSTLGGVYGPMCFLPKGNQETFKWTFVPL